MWYQITGIHYSEHRMLQQLSRQNHSLQGQVQFHHFQQILRLHQFQMANIHLQMRL